MAEMNNIIGMTRHDSETEEQGIQTGRPPNTMDDLMRAVEQQLAHSKKELIEGVTKAAIPALREAVKHALDADTPSSSTTKRPRVQKEFRNKGNQKRYEANADIIEKIDDAMGALAHDDLEDAKSALAAGRQLLITQRKAISLADREEHGWEVVRHYESDDLASDPDDEKRINRARREALAAIKKRKQERSAGIVAQWIRHLTANQGIPGSSPGKVAREIP